MHQGPHAGANNWKKLGRGQARWGRKCKIRSSTKLSYLCIAHPQLHKQWGGKSKKSKSAAGAVSIVNLQNLNLSTLTAASFASLKWLKDDCEIDSAHGDQLPMAKCWSPQWLWEEDKFGFLFSFHLAYCLLVKLSLVLQTLRELLTLPSSFSIGGSSDVRVYLLSQ